MSLYKIGGYDNFKESGNILARAGTIKAYGQDIDTPIPIPTSSDFEKLNKLRRSVRHLRNLEFIQPIIEINRFYSEKKLKNLEKSPSASDRIVTQLNDICDKANLTMFRHIVSRDVGTSDKMNDIFTEIAIQMCTDFILIHDKKFSSSVSDFDKRISKTREYIESHHDREKYCSILPVIRMDIPTDLFERKINIAEDNGFEGMVFIYVPYYTLAWKSYLHIQKIAQDKDIWFHLAGCSDTWHVNKKTSLSHILMLFGFDSFSIQTKIGRGNKPLPFKFKKFNDKTWGITDQSEWNNCECPVCKGYKDADSFINAYNGAQIASPALKYHNVTSSYKEFMMARKSTIHRELQELMRKKKYAVEAVKDILKKDLEQKSLNKWG